MAVFYIVFAHLKQNRDLYCDLTKNDYVIK